LLSSEGVADLIGSRDTLRTAFRVGLIEDGSTWMAMIQDRNLTSHTYNRATAREIGAHIAERYLHCFQALRHTLERREP
jgi:nucleotidyltransferase substrate binding protein (TIGR01987 family)